MSELADKKCLSCAGGGTPLARPAIQDLQTQLHESWRVVDEHHLARDFDFPDFAQALAFTNAIGAVAEQEDHHPDLLLAWGKVGVTIFTHSIEGLSEADFILAAKIDRL